MEIALAQAGLRFRKLNEDQLGRCAEFQNQKVELVDFLREDAFHQQDLKISVTYMAYRLEGGDACLGYLALLNDSVRIDENTELGLRMRKKEVQYHYLPALKIGRFAVDSSCQGKGIGTGMLQFAIFMAIECSKKAGCRFLVVDSKKPAESFYARNGFKPLVRSKSETIKMYLDLAEKQE